MPLPAGIPAVRRASSSRAMLLLLIALIGGGCRHAPQADAIKLACDFTPSPPKQGTAQIRLTLIGEDNRPLTHASVSLEGELAHAGMTPSFANIQEVGNGVYMGSINFSMPGEWTLIVDILEPSGDTVKKAEKVHVVGGIEDPFKFTGPPENPFKHPPISQESSPAPQPPTSIDET